ncbi:MAG: hypothetical protein OQK63_02175, partial [Ignavibacteriaceae bacterium]|nr:hypothetical protein [Ignavibacteriaceae bacterium]
MSIKFITSSNINFNPISVRKVGSLLFLFILILSLPIFPQWTRTNGPEGIAVSSLANINGIIYAGTEVNGVYISTDDGVSWTARNAGIETYG